MSKYDALWAWIRENGTDSFNLTFAEIKQIAGVSIDHSFLASKKELMVQFCIAYCRVLSQHTLVATGTTGKMVSEATGLPIQRFLSGTHGGDQQIAARIACNEIDLLLFFRDPINAKPHEPNELNLLRLCDMHSVPIATNIATAEVLIHGLENGDLDWLAALHHSG